MRPRESVHDLWASKITERSSPVTKVNLLLDEVSAWPGISIHPHRFGGREFRFGAAEVGHVHTGGILDIPFPRSLRDALLREGLAEEHRWVPDSGWITFSIRTDHDLKHAVWLMRLSYLRYALKKAADPRQMIAEESERLRLNAQFTSLLEQLVPKTTEFVPGSRSA
jgi:Family of unknown function (DUF5519)